MSSLISQPDCDGTEGKLTVVLQHRKVNRKMDICVLPVLASLYLMSGIDRSNVGNAAVRHRSFPI